MQFDDVRYDSPYSFSIPQRMMLTLVPPILSRVLWLCYSACEWKVFNWEHFENTLKSDGRVLVAFWHEHMMVGACVFRGTNYHTLTSYSYDGEMAARVVRYFGLEAVRGSSSKGGKESLLDLKKALYRLGCVGWTLDGPRGPRRVAKPGMAVLSARTRTSIVPMGAVISKAWRLHSWDRFPIPKPFAKIYVGFGAPIAPPEGEDKEQIEMKRKEIEDSLNRLIVRLSKVTGIVEGE